MVITRYLNFPLIIFGKHTSASDRASAINGGTPPSRPIAMLLQGEREKKKRQISYV